MKTQIFSIGLLLAASARAEAPKPLSFSIGVASDACDALLVSDEAAKLPSETPSFQLKPIRMKAGKKLEFRSCKIFWRPDVAAGLKIKGGKLIVEGELRGKAEATLRLGHELLGLDGAAKVETWTVKEGPFEVQLAIQNLSEQSCREESRLTSNISVLLRTPAAADGETALPELTFKSLRLEAIEGEPCAEPAGPS